MEKYLSWIHSGDLHKAHSEDGETTYYAAFFEEWEIPVVMFPQNKQRGTLRVCTFNFFTCTNKTKHEGNANKQPCMHGWAHRETLRFRGILYHCDLQHSDTHTHIHGEPLPNPSPQTGVQQSESYVPPLTAILIIVG